VNVNPAFPFLILLSAEVNIILGGGRGWVGGIKDGEIQNIPVPRNTQHTAIFSSEILEMRVYIKQIFPFLLHLTKGKVNIN
jgi:hypothetical protein